MKRLTGVGVVAGVGLFLCCAQPASAQSSAAITVLGTAFVLRLSDGRVLGPNDLIGAILKLRGPDATPLAVRIDSIGPDPRDPSGEILLYGLSMRRSEIDAWSPLCKPDPEGLSRGFPISGRWDFDDAPAAMGDDFSLLCTSGVQGKCVRFGFGPWKKTSDGPPMADLMRTCIHMMRADYCGDGTPHTRDGTPIYFQERTDPEPRPGDVPPGMTFEAAWGPGGAICVYRPRWPDLLSLSELARRCPRLAGRLGPICTEAAARQNPASLLFNRSLPRD